MTTITSSKIKTNFAFRQSCSGSVGTCNDNYLTADIFVYYQHKSAVYFVEYSAYEVRINVFENF